MNPADSVPHFLECVERLPYRDQDLLLELVRLMSLAAPDVQRQTKRMIHEVLDAAPRSHLECQAGVVAVIEYLETSIEDQDPEWVPPLWRESILPIPD